MTQILSPADTGDVAVYQTPARRPDADTTAEIRLTALPAWPTGAEMAVAGRTAASTDLTPPAGPTPGECVGRHRAPGPIAALLGRLTPGDREAHRG